MKKVMVHNTHTTNTMLSQTPKIVIALFIEQQHKQHFLGLQHIGDLAKPRWSASILESSLSSEFAQEAIIVVMYRSTARYSIEAVMTIVHPTPPSQPVSTCQVFSN